MHAWSSRSLHGMLAEGARAFAPSFRVLEVHGTAGSHAPLLPRRDACTAPLASPPLRATTTRRAGRVRAGGQLEFRQGRRLRVSRRAAAPRRPPGAAPRGWPTRRRAAEEASRLAGRSALGTWRGEDEGTGVAPKRNRHGRVIRGAAETAERTRDENVMYSIIYGYSRLHLRAQQGLSANGAFIG